MYRLICMMFIFSLVISGCNDSTRYNINSGIPGVATKTDNLSWFVSSISEVQVSTKNGELSVVPFDTNSVVANIYRLCEAPSEYEADSGMDSISISYSINNGLLDINLEMPDSENEFIYIADVRILLPPFMNLSLATLNGAIIVYDYSSSVNAATMNGNIAVEILELADSDTLDLTSMNGDIFLSIPRYISATFDASSINGTVSVYDFYYMTLSVDEESHKSGVIGDGEATIILSTINGDIEIKRQDL